jgi:type I restriction enzyme M protein
MKEKDLTFEDKLWKAADKLRKKVEVHEYKYIVLGLIFLSLIFLRYVSLEYSKLLKEEEKLNYKIKEVFKALGWEI